MIITLKPQLLDEHWGFLFQQAGHKLETLKHSNTQLSYDSTHLYLRPHRIWKILARH